MQCCCFLASHCLEMQRPENTLAHFESLLYVRHGLPVSWRKHLSPFPLAEFRAIMMSTGGLVARETADEIGKWKKELGEWTFEKMMGRISLELLKSRARLFEV